MQQLSHQQIKITSEAEALAILAEVQRLTSVPPRRFHDPEHKAQMAFFKDRAMLKAAQCTRRAGKSYGVGQWLLEPVMEEHEVTTLYLAKTRGSARDIMWRDILKRIAREMGLELKANESMLTLTNPVTGSLVRLGGIDASPDEMAKLLGGKLRRVAIDECADIRQDLTRTVYEILLPALADHEGELAMIGTTGQLLKGLFYDVTTGKKKGWSVHKWTWKDNPYVRRQMEKQITELKAAEPRIAETPAFRRMYMNEWVADASRLVYQYAADRNDIAELADVGKRIHVLGVDLGFNDATAFAVASFGPGARRCDFVDGYKKSGMTISDVAERLDYYRQLYDPYAYVVDGAAKQAVEELRQRFGFPLVSAEKQGKSEVIEILNSELIAGRVGFLQPAMAPLTAEYPDLIWDDKSARRAEHPACENHGADAILYAWRHCHYHLSAASLPRRQTELERLEQWEEDEAERVMTEQSKPFWER